MLEELAHDAENDLEATLLRQLARGEARRSAQREAWTAQQVVTYERDHDIDPRTPDQLFHIALLRLNAFRDEVERNDFGGTKAFAPQPDEAEVQKHVALWLQTHAKGRYDLVREEQVKDEKRTDIRLRRTLVAGVVTIEIKRAEAWKLEQLEAAIEDQLVERYMKPHTSRHGVLLVARTAEKLKWTGADGTEVSYEDGLVHLERAARALLARRSDVRALEVVGVDMRSLVKPQRRAPGTRWSCLIRAF